MSIQTVFRNIDFSADEPFRKRRFPFEDALPRRAPDQFSRLARPELRRARERFSMHSPILSEALNSRLFRKLFRRLEDPLLLQMRLDIVVHVELLISLSMQRVNTPDRALVSAVGASCSCLPKRQREDYAHV